MTAKSKSGYVKGKLYSIHIASLNSDPDQPRKYVDAQALDELTASVKQYGVLEPVLFRQDSNQSLYLVAGERRCLAAQKAGITELPAIFVEGNYAEIALVENLLRQDLTPIEESEAMDRIMKEHSYKQEDLSNMLGKAVSTISETLSLNRLPQQIRDECRNNPSVPKRVLVEIARSKQESSMISQYQKYCRKNLSPEELKEERQKQKKPEAQIMLEALQNITIKINKLSLNKWSEPDRQELQTITNAIKDAVEIKLKETTATVGL
ncbi:MAG: ParB/RepB/Spo0J family partition protein [Proteobacteria bacterium]|nr:ParB/RepB/Spo0J family partition protein [Pseudomonadota bacterium]